MIFQRRTVRLIITASLFAGLPACKDHTVSPSISNNVSANIEATNSQLKKGPSVVFLEGPAWRSDGTLFFTDVQNNKIMAWKNGGPPMVHRTPTGQANGLVIDSQDRLVIAETAGRIVRESVDGTIEVLADSFEGMRFNAPNDLTLDAQGRIYFTDTRYRNKQGATLRDKNGNILNAVYRLDPSGKILRILNSEVAAPNGIVLSPDNKSLYIADNDSSNGGKRTLVRFELGGDGNVVGDSKVELYDWGTDRGPDGMTIDVEGNIYVTAGLNHPLPGKTNIHHKAGIYVFSPDGTLIKTIPVPMDSTSNVTFGGSDFSTLYITGGHSIWMYDVGIKGYRPY